MPGHDRLEDRTGPDSRVPVVTLVPQFAAVLAVADDPDTAMLAFLLSAAANGPLYVVGRFDARRAGIAWARPLVALVWAGMCAVAAATTDGPTSEAARAAAYASVGIAVLVHVVPGGWTWEGWRLAARRDHGLPVARDYCLAVMRRAFPVLLLTAVVLFPTAPSWSVAVACLLLVVMVVEHAVMASGGDRRIPEDVPDRERITTP